MPHSYDLVALGDPVLDLVVHSEQLPSWDDKHVGRSAHWTSGGSEANAACAAAKLGLRCALFGHAGQGIGAALHRQELALHGVSIEDLTSDDGRDGAVAVVYVSADGERAITYVPTAGSSSPKGDNSFNADDQDADPQPLPQAWARAASQARMLYTLPYDAARLHALSKVAQAHQSRIAVDIERAVLDQPGMHEALRAVPDVLCFNAAGFRAFTGATEITGDALHRALDQARADALVVTLGADGALGLERAGTVVYEAAWPARVVDSTGAGDAFNGAWLAAWLQGQTMAQSLMQGAWLAKHCIEHPGPRTYLHHLIIDMDGKTEGPGSRAARVQVAQSRTMTRNTPT